MSAAVYDSENNSNCSNKDNSLDDTDPRNESDSSGEDFFEDYSVPNASKIYIRPSPVGRRSFSGIQCDLKALLDEKIIEAGKGLLCFDILNRQFTGDLLENGSIRWVENRQIFTNPSTWLNYCKRIMGTDTVPAGKNGYAWATIKYKGKRLDTYKLRWYRRHKKKMKFLHGNSSEIISGGAYKLPHSQYMMPDGSGGFSMMGPQMSDSWHGEDDSDNETNVVDHFQLGSRYCIQQDHDVMVKCIPFSALERVQPFNITISSNVMLLIDFHSHLTNGEVIGYLGGAWDVSSHILSILQAFPCKNRLNDHEKSPMIEDEVRKNLESKNLQLIGWYHSHPFSAPQPTVKDIETQIDYQLTLRGDNDVSYLPCIGLITSPYDSTQPRAISRCQAFWVIPPTNNPHEYGKPMQMLYTVIRDSFLTQDLLFEMRSLANFYIECIDAINFADEIKLEGLEDVKTYWEKLQKSLEPNLPGDLQPLEGQSDAQIECQQQALSHFWSFLKGLVMP